MILSDKHGRTRGSRRAWRTFPLELGHLDLVVQAAGERGEWFCALAAVRELCAVEDHERAWSVIEPFAVTG